MRAKKPGSGQTQKHLWDLATERRSSQDLFEITMTHIYYNQLTKVFFQYEDEVWWFVLQDLLTVGQM